MKAEGAVGKLHFYAPIPIFAVGCTVARMRLGHSPNGMIGHEPASP